MTNENTQQHTSVDSQDKPQYHSFFESHGLKVKDSELAEESDRMVKDDFSLFNMWRFRASQDLRSQVPDMPGCATSLEFETTEKDPRSPQDLVTVDDLPDDMLHALETSNTHSPSFTMAGYMARMQEARENANLIKEHTGLDVYKREDFLKMRDLVMKNEDPLLGSILGTVDNVGSGGLHITSDTFNSLQGNPNVPVTGAWFDGPQYPKELRETWLEKGEYLSWTRNPARLLDAKVMFGEKIGTAVHEWHVGNILKTMAWDKTKIGGKLIGFGFGLWFVTIVLGKRYQLQYRDHMTNQMIFAERLNSLDDYYPATEANIHKQIQLRGYLQNYFEEDEDDEEI